MALFRKFFYKKPPDGLLEISERVYVFDCCFTTDILEDEEYKVYISSIVSQLREHSPDASFMVFNFREGEHQSQISSILSDYDMTVMDYPRHYEGCPLLTMEMIHHFLRSSESWLSLGQQNVLLMHCERGGWPVLAFMLAALLIYRKQFTGEQKTLDMIYKQAPRELLQLMSPLNPLPSQLRYLQYVSRRNVGLQWPPLDRALTLDCVILRVIPNMDGEGGCRPIFRIYGPDPFMASDRTPKVLFSASKRGKHVRLYNQADSDLIKLDIHCHVQGDVVMECISLDSDQEREQMMFRVMFNTAFIRSNILMLNREEIDTLWDAKDQFPKNFRVEVLFSEMDSSGSLASFELPILEEKDGLPVEAFAKVQEFFCQMDWLETKPDVAANMLQNIVALQGKLDTGSALALRRDPALLESAEEKVQGRLQFEESGNHSESPTMDKTHEQSVTFLGPPSDASSTNKRVQPYQSESAIQTTLPTEPASDANTVKKQVEPRELQVVLQRPAQPKIISQRVPQASLSSPGSSSTTAQGSPMHATRYQAPMAVGITALLHDHGPSSGDEVVRPVSVSLSSSTISSPVSNVPKTVHLSMLSSPKTPLLPPPPPPRLASSPLSQSISKMVDTSVENGKVLSSPRTPPPPPHLPPPRLVSSPLSQSKSKLSDPSVENGKVLSSITDSNEVSPSTPTPFSDPVSSPCPIMKSPSSAPIPSPPPLPSFPRGSKLLDENSQVPSRITSAPPPPPLPPTPFSPLKTSSPSIKSLSPAPPPSPPPLPSFSRGSGLPAFDKSPLETTVPDSSPSIINNAPLDVPSPPGPSCSETSQPSFPTVPPAPPPPPRSHVVSPSVAGSISSFLSGKNSAIPELRPPPGPSRSDSVAAQARISSMPPPPPPLKSIPKDPVSESTAQPPPVPSPPPPTPFPKGLPRSSNASPPTPAVDNEKVPSVPMPPPSAAFNLKGRSQPRASLRNQTQTRKANLKPYHWLKLSRAMQGSLWAETQKCDETCKPPEFDLSELESLFSAATSDPVGTGGKSKRTSGSKTDKVQLIELRRAYNCEIMLSKVKVPLGDLMSSMLALDDLALDVDQVDNLIKFCPTKEEMDLLKIPYGKYFVERTCIFGCQGYTGDKENLGRCEQFFLELMKVPRVESKLRVFSFKLQFHHQVSDLRNNLNVVNSTSEEIRGSVKLKKIMQTILSLGNALNQGTARGAAVGFRLDSLLKLTDTRARNNKMTLMHYLCKVLAEKLPELLEFPKDLKSLEAATKIQLKYLAEEMQAVSKGLEKVVQELSASENDGPVSETFRHTLKAFLSSAESEVRSLASMYSNVGRNADALALYFGEDPARCPFEQVVSTLLNFVRMFVRAHEENRKQLEIERKRAEKDAENEKSKMGAVRKGSENLIRTPIRSGNVS